MKRVMAVLMVTESDSPKGSPSHLQFDSRFPRVFQLVVKPEVDKTVYEEKYGIKVDRRVLESIVAHELGHFICTIFGDPTHANLKPVGELIEEEKAGRASDVCRDLLPAERRAWELAQEMLKELSQEVASASLHSYER